MEYIFLGVDSLLVSVLYYYYKKKSKILLNIKNASEVNLSNQLAVNEVIDYGMIVGKVSPDNIELTSNFDKYYTGVIRVYEIREHGTTFRNHISEKTNRLISRVINDVPFSLVNQDKIRVHVEQALNADYLQEYLELTHTKFDQVQQSTLAKIFADLTSKDSVKGIETTEKMLRNGTLLTAFGKIERLPVTTSSSWLSTSDPYPHYRISEPTIKGNYKFILTPMSRNALIDKLTQSKRILKISLFIFTIMGGVVGVYCAYKFINEYLDKRKREQQITQARLERLKIKRERARRYDDETNNNSNVNNNTNNNEDREQSPCVICLMNPRELVLLDCGHVCLCMDCFERMPNSICPICRQRFRTFVHCYIP